MRFLENKTPAVVNNFVFKSLVKSVRSIMDVSGFSSIQLQRFLIDKGFGEQVASNFQENEIDGAVKEQLKEVAPKISERIKLKKLQQSSPPDKVCKAFVV